MAELKFIKITDSSAVEDYLTQQIEAHLKKGQSVTWLLSGGSAINVALKVAEQLRSSGTRLQTLSVSLIDERFGKPGHADSNWFKLEQAGLSLPGAKLHPVLEGKGMGVTAADFEAWLKQNLVDVDYSIGLLGVGPDGHTSGILPHSPAVEAEGWVAAYEGPDFQRITTTAAALQHLSEAAVYAVGENKRQALDNLDSDLSLAEQPAQLLKQLSKVTIFNDYKGDE